MNSNILCADIGTTSLKAGIINSNGEVVSFSVKQFSATQTDFIAKDWFQEFIQCAVHLQGVLLILVYTRLCLDDAVGSTC